MCQIVRYLIVDGMATVLLLHVSVLYFTLSVCTTHFKLIKSSKQSWEIMHWVQMASCIIIKIWVAVELDQSIIMIKIMVMM